MFLDEGAEGGWVDGLFVLHVQLALALGEVCGKLIGPSLVFLVELDNELALDLVAKPVFV